MLHTFFGSLFVRLSSVKDFNDVARGSFGIDVISPLSGDVEKRHRLFRGSTLMEDGRMGPFVLFWDRRNIKVDSAKVGDCPPPFY